MKHWAKIVHDGFILPATILLGLGVSIVSVTFVQYIISSSGTLSAQTYNIIAENTAYSGVSYALSCIAAASTSWPSLSPHTTCSGLADAGAQETTSRSPGGEWTTTFRVNSYNVNVDRKITSVGTVTLASGVEINVTRSMTITNALRQVPVPSSSDKVVTDLSTDSHSCAIANGQLYCWGLNNAGQLGDGTTSSRANPTRVTYFTGMMVTQVAVGTSNTCAVADGQLYCWGNNSQGQLGIGTAGGTPSYRTTPQAVLKPDILPDFKVTSVAISQSSSSRTTACAVANGITFCWGDNSHGQVGQYSRDSAFGYTSDTTARTKPTPVWGYRAGDNASYADLYGKKSTSVSTGSSHGCNIANGIMHCWGDTLSGLRRLSASTNGDYSSAPLAQPWSAKVVNQGFCSVNDQIICRGTGIFGTNGDRIFSSAPDDVSSFPVRGATSYDSDDWSSGSDGVMCAVIGGFSWCRGNRDYVGALGLFGNPVRNPISPTYIYLRSVTKVGVGERYGCIVTNGGLACWGDRTNGQLADGTFTGSRKVTPEVSGYPTIGVWQDTPGWQHDFAATGPLSAGDAFRCTTANAVLFCWGSNSWQEGATTKTGKLGTETTTSQGQPTMTNPDNLLNFNITNPDDPSDTFTAPFTAVEKISSSNNHSCMISTNLTGPSLYCWGQNNHGQLGTGDTNDKDKPTATSTYNFFTAPYSWTSGRIVTDVSTGPRNTCAIADGRLYCWGDRTSGIVGSSSSTGNATTPVLVDVFASNDYQVTSVSVGENHACAVANGDLYCWGNNANCATGHSPCSGSIPIYCSGTSSCNTRRNAARVTTGTMATTYGNLPTANVTQVSAGNGYSCAVINATISCWGRSNLGQTGTGGSNDVTAPTAIATAAGTLQAEVISAGDNHACAVLQGRIYCWGDNTNGKIGDGTVDTRLAPVFINGGDISDRVTVNVAAGSDGTCSISNGTVLCWGAGLSGQIGDNGWAHRDVPTRISGYRMSGECETFNCSGPLY